MPVPEGHEWLYTDSGELLGLVGMVVYLIRESGTNEYRQLASRLSLIRGCKTRVFAFSRQG